MRCLSRMSGNLQVRFLGGGAVATSPCYPAIEKRRVTEQAPTASFTVTRNHQTANTLRHSINESTATALRRYSRMNVLCQSFKEVRQRLADAGKRGQFVDQNRSLTCRCTVAADLSFVWLRQFPAAAR